MVSASFGEFESDCSSDSSIKNELFLPYFLGMKKIILLVNKMDEKSVLWSESRFVEIKAELTKILKRIGYNPEIIEIIPISSWLGDNFVKPSSNMPWYKGMTLLQVLDSLPPPESYASLPFRMSIDDVYKIKDIGYVPVGKVETGILKKGKIVTFAPSNVTGECIVIERKQMRIDEAPCGYTIGLQIKSDYLRNVRRGHICGDISLDPPSSIISFEAEIVILNHPTKITVGYSPVIDCHKAHIGCQLSEIKCKIDRRTKKIIENSPCSLVSGDLAIVTFIPLKKICLRN